MLFGSFANKSHLIIIVNSQVTLRQAQLLLGWVTVYGQVNHLGM